MNKDLGNPALVLEIIISMSEGQHLDHYQESARFINPIRRYQLNHSHWHMKN